MKSGRNKDLICARNQALIARYYYWAEIWGKGFYKTLEILSQQEFFISELTIQREILKNDKYLKDLRNGNTSVKKLECLFPGFSFKNTLKIQHPNKHQKSTV